MRELRDYRRSISCSIRTWFLYSLQVKRTPKTRTKPRFSWKLKIKSKRKLRSRSRMRSRKMTRVPLPLSMSLLQVSSPQYLKTEHWNNPVRPPQSASTESAQLNIASETNAQLQIKQMRLNLKRLLKELRTMLLKRNRNSTMPSMSTRIKWSMSYKKINPKCTNGLDNCSQNWCRFHLRRKEC